MRIKRLNKQMQQPQPVAMRTADTIAADRCLKVIIHDRVVVWITRQTVFLHQPVVRILTAAKHIVAKPVHAGGKLGKANAVTVFFGNIRPAVLGDLIAGAGLARCVRHVVVYMVAGLVIFMQVSADLIFSFGGGNGKAVIGL